MLARVRTSSSPVIEREIKRERERERERERKRGREREMNREREGESERERESGREGKLCRIIIFISKGMTGALAPFSYLVKI